MQAHKMKKSFISSKNGVIFFFITGSALYFFINIQRVAIPGAVFDEIQHHWQLAPDQVTALGSWFMYIYAVAQLFVGALIAKFGGIRVILAGGLLLTICSTIQPFAPDYVTLSIARIAGGAGASCIYLGLITETMRYCKKNYAIIISFIIMTGYSGGVFANAPFSYLTGKFDLITVLESVAFITAVVFCCFALSVMNIRKPQIKKGMIPLSSLWHVLKNRHNLLVFCFTAMNWGIFYSLQTVIGKKYLEDFCDMPTQTAAIALSATSIFSAFGGFFYAWFSKKIGNRRRPFCRLTAVVTPLSCILLLALTAFGIKSYISVIILICLGSVSSLSSTMIPVLRETNPEEITSSAIAVLNCLCYLAVAIFGDIIGHCLESFPAMEEGTKLIYPAAAYTMVFAIVSAFALLITFCGFKLKETNGKRIY